MTESEQIRDYTGDWGYGSGVFRKGTLELYTSHGMYYMPPLFLFDNEAEAYRQEHL